MKKFLLITLFALNAINAIAQVYGNEWIDFSKTYYKFPVWVDRVCRIDNATLLASGIPASTTGAQFEMYKNGKKVPIRVSKQGVFGATDYIEFYGTKMDGSLDAELYHDKTAQLNKKMNLMHDTAYYFLTVNNVGVSSYQYNQGSNVLSSLPPKENFCWDSLNLAISRSNFNSGEDHNTSNSYVFYSSRFEGGEGFIKGLIWNKPDSVLMTCTNLYRDPSAPPIVSSAWFNGFSSASHKLKLEVNNSFVGDSVFSTYKGIAVNINTSPQSLPTTNVLKYKYTPYYGGGNDVVALSTYYIYYPRIFNFSGVNSKYFEIDAKVNDYYVEITNFTTGSVAPLLYNINDAVYYEGDISVTGQVRFKLPATTKRTAFVLVNNALATNKLIINALRPISFKPINTGTNQGNYLMLYPNNLSATGSTDYLQDYKSYRESTAGGAYKVALVDFNEIYEQFGYGHHYHAAGVHRFLKYITNNWALKPEYVLLVGKGLEYRNFSTYHADMAANPNFYNFKVVTPTFGVPGSDNLLVDYDLDGFPNLKVGRVGCFDMNELGSYLNKVKEYESLTDNLTNQTYKNEAWKKQILHIAGGKTINEQAGILGAFERQTDVIESYEIGGKVTQIAKDVSDPLATIDNKFVDSLVNNGVGFIQYYGHSNPVRFEFGLNSPVSYNPLPGRYSVFLANGCDAGDMFYMVPSSLERALTEEAILTNEKGSIAFIGSSNAGYPGFLDRITDSMYTLIRGQTPYQNLGTVMQKNANKMLNGAQPFMRVHVEQIMLHGDPAVYYQKYTGPDYDVEDEFLTFTPSIVNTLIDSFDMHFNVFNLAKYSNDSIVLRVKRSNSTGLNSIIFEKSYPHGFGFVDSITVRIPVNQNLYKGVNTFEIFIDAEDVVSEITETNNKITRTILIEDEEIIAAQPTNFSIVYNQGLNLIANTFNAFAPVQDYIFQIDTTTKFNSSQFLNTKINSAGGAISWQPNLTLLNNVVYYWRVAKDTLGTNVPSRWSNSSFIYLANGSDGWNQSHYYQYLDNGYSNLVLENNRNFNFFNGVKNISSTVVCFGNAAPNNFNYLSIYTEENGRIVRTFGCNWNVLQFILVDTISGTIVNNVQDPVTDLGRWGSNFCLRESEVLHEFGFSTSTLRKKVMDFLDSVPKNYLVILNPMLISNGGKNTVFAKQMASDTAVFGSNNSLYHKFQQLGISNIDSFYKNRPFVFVINKAKPNTSYGVFGQDSISKLVHAVNINVNSSNGSMQSVIIGRATKWNTLKRFGYSRNNVLTDTTQVEVYGLDSNKYATYLATVYGNDTSLSFIDAVQYPYLKLKYLSSDKLNRTAEQLSYWRVLYDKLPDLAITPNINYSFKTQYEEGEDATFTIGIKNITPKSIDSTVGHIIIKDLNNQILKTIPFTLPAFLGNGSYTLTKTFNTKGLAAKNLLSIQINIPKKPSEETFFNNTGSSLFNVSFDVVNPLIDVTFDGVHIMKDDIVSAYPFIKAKIKDENKYLLLDDTSLVQVYLTKPNNGSKRRIYFNTDTLRFTPSNSAIDNSAFLEYQPRLLEDGIYELEIIGKDKKGNETGKYSYRITFKVINKQMSSYMVNYPNPFSTSTQFVFTLTGSQVPDNIKIQIMSITGKIVREITKNELGPLHIGKNLTEFKWDGTDAFGDKLGNGVYFYRMVTSHKGKEIEAYQIESLDKFFKKGMGKLVIMR